MRFLIVRQREEMINELHHQVVDDHELSVGSRLSKLEIVLVEVHPVAWLLNRHYGHQVET